VSIRPEKQEAMIQAERILERFGLKSKKWRFRPKEFWNGSA
jgi:hypothetical protein